MSSGLVTADRSERVTFLNQAGGDILGIVPGRGRREAALRHRPGPAERLERAPPAHARPRGLPRRDRRSSAATRDGSWATRSRALKDPDGEEGALIVFQDLTEVKKLERQARFNEQLAAVGELAAGIAHEIRNPLASISGSVQVLSHELSVGSAERRLMEIIVSESQPPLEDPGGVPALRPARRSAAWPPSTSAGNIQEVLRALPPLGRDVRRAPDRDRRRARPSRCCPGDRDQIRQIIYNVAKNAVRAMPDGRIADVEGREDGAWYSIKFRDTGRGMSDGRDGPRLHALLHGLRRGHGLGMAIVRRIVEDHGGAIDVRIQAGRGNDRDHPAAAQRERPRRRPDRRPCGPRPCNERRRAS